MLSAPCALLNHSRRSRSTEWQQLAGLDSELYELRKCLHIVFRTCQVVVEVSSHFEQAAELLVIVAQHVVEPTFADQYDLDVQGNRLWLEGRRTHKPQRVRWRFDTHLPRE